jgi:mevalonate kinase
LAIAKAACTRCNEESLQTLHPIYEIIKNSYSSNLIAPAAQSAHDQFPETFDHPDLGKHGRSNFNNSCPELDELIAYALADNRCVGARLSGGGFGGISIHLVKKKDAEDYRTSLLKTIASVNPTARWSAICEINNGVQIHNQVI